MATEIAILRLQAGKRPDDASSGPGQIFKDALDTLTEQPGFQRAYWGREVENPDNLRLFVDWDSVDAHIDFTKKDYYQPFLDQFGAIAINNQAKIFHTHYTPHPADEALSDHVSPATEIITLYFPASYSDSDQQKFVEDFKKLVAAVEKDAGTYRASSGGWVVEELPVPGTSEKGKAYSAVIGWDSVEAHMAFRETQSFRDNIHYLREAKDLKHVEAVHYHGTQVNKGAGGVADLSGDALPGVQGEILNPQVGGSKDPPKARADGTTTKNNDDLKGAANALHKERVGRA